MKTMTKQKSFTLIELLVVIVIIGILAGVIMISTSSSIDKANITKLKVFEESVANNLAANMVSRWKLDGNANDSWGSNNGTLVNGPTWKSGSDCISGECLSFDGVDDYVSIGAIPNMDFSESFSIGAWANLSQFGDSRSSCGNKRANIVRVGTNPSGVVELGTITPNHFWASIRTTSSWLGFSTSGIINNWTYVVFVNDESANKINLFINGKRTNQSSYDEVMENKGIVNIGGTTPNCSYGHINGLIDDVRIYNDALSSFQIKQNYVAGLNSLLNIGSISKEEYNERINTLAYNY